MTYNKWFKFADEELIDANILLEHKRYNSVCYHAQQSVEKYLKGFLSHHQIEPPLTHNLKDLSDLCGKINPNFNKF